MEKAHACGKGSDGFSFRLHQTVWGSATNRVPAGSKCNGVARDKKLLAVVKAIQWASHIESRGRGITSQVYGKSEDNLGQLRLMTF